MDDRRGRRGRDTGELRIRWVCVEDAGRVLHPRKVDGQIAGAIAQGITGALCEHLVHDEAGNPVSGTLMDYLLPTAAEVPDFVIGERTHPADNPLGVRERGRGRDPGAQHRPRRRRHRRPRRRCHPPSHHPRNHLAGTP